MGCARNRHWILLLAVLVIFLAERRAATVLQRLSAHAVVTAGFMHLRLFAVLVSVGSLALIAAIWIVRNLIDQFRIRSILLAPRRRSAAS